MNNKLTFLVLLFILSITAYAQNSSAQQNKQYCEVRVELRNYKKIKVYVDYGRGDQSLTNTQGKELVFESHVGVVNYMGEQGWEVLDIHREGRFAHFFMKRKNN